MSVVLLGVVGFVLLHAEDSALIATTKTTVVTVRLPTVLTRAQGNTALSPGQFPIYGYGISDTSGIPFYREFRAA